MERIEDIKLLLAGEQTLLSRERTMHSYMQTGLAFTSVGILIMKFVSGVFYHSWSPPDCRVRETVYALPESYSQAEGEGSESRIRYRDDKVTSICTNSFGNAQFQ